MTYRVLVFVLLASNVAAQGLNVSAPAPRGFDRAVAQADTLALLKQLVALDTQNPPGNEILVARHLDAMLRGVPGIETHILDPGDGRANFIARLRAVKPTRRAVLVMGHMDVVGAEASKWTSPPFQAVERDGYLYGRGTIDDKGALAATAVAMRMLASLRDSLDRDIILLGTAAEESGGEQGITRVLAQHFDLIKDAEFALNEGGRIRVRNGQVNTINIQVTEKLSYAVIATARGTSGHASVQLQDNAIAALSRALARVHDTPQPVELNEVTRAYFGGLAKVEADPVMRQAMESLTTARDRASIDKATAVVSRDPVHNTLLRNTASLTMLAGGIRVNIIPSEVTATLNLRELPDGDVRAHVADLNRVGAEKQVTFTLRGEPRKSPPVSSTTSALYLAMEATGREMAPQAAVIPMMSSGATDGAALRAAGIPTYGILPLPLDMDDELRMHGDNERTPIASLGWATEYLYRVLMKVAVR
ncbi:MAG TPA: M20/M25/M40 family metallo-hydrolase [Vicinamibacterales bacterium]|nr:M20/M25/M40 family metallo-hydrolase [Vicinamibacterales bacterium]